MIFELKPLSKKDLEVIINRALNDEEKGLGKYKIKLDNSAKELIINYSDGDARRVLNALELGTLIAKKNNTGTLNFDLKIAEEVMQRKKIVYDKSDAQHYDTISAFIKSMRGSDPDATVYWLAKMLSAGEDPRFIARRIAIHAAEDVGLADPQALIVANSAFQILEFVGMPEARIALAEAALYVACAPKSNACYKAIDEAILDIENELTKEIPKHLRNSHYKSAKKLQEGYLYPHDYDNHFVKQEYLPNKKRYYQPTEQGYELTIKNRLKKLWQD
jgi:putative ATPase